MSTTAVVGIVIGMTVAFVVGVLTAITIPFIEVPHDPEKMLKLRTECLEHDPGLFTTYCNNYAEKFSRIEPHK
jgi:hypothetical protein